ncbi:hypothetical protein BH24CHL10_BH24CHL10_11450 [soil metagenome]
MTDAASVRRTITIRTPAVVMGISRENQVTFASCTLPTRAGERIFRLLLTTTANDRTRSPGPAAQQDQGADPRTRAA